MKKVQKLLLMVVGMTFIMACEPNHPESNINLNNGEKWKVNGEMKPHIEMGYEVLNDFNLAEDKDFRQLADKLEEQNNALIKSCTMKGESHDELHKWLHPHIVLINELSNAENPDDAELIIEKLEDSFEDYHNYFQ